MKKGCNAEKSKTASQLREDLVQIIVVVCTDSLQHFLAIRFVMKFQWLSPVRNPYICILLIILKS